MTEKDIDNAAVTRASKKTDSSEKTAAAKAKEKASGKTAAAKKPAASGKTTAAKKPAASGKTTAAKKPAAKKPATAKKTSSALRLSAEEKKLIQNYRKCNSVAKMMITAAVEKAAEKYGLTILLRGFQNNPHNTTRFLLITKNLYIEDSADKISLCFSLPHVTGSLYHILGRLAADGLNLTKIESRPKPNTDFEYLFYLDFTGTIKDPRTLALLCALSEEMTDFSFLGNYKSM